MPNPISDLATLLTIAKQRGIETDTLKNKVSDDVVNYRRALVSAKRMANMKARGSAGTNTGPFIGRIPKVAVDVIGAINPEFASDRRMMEQENLNMMNPYRKEVTGAAAPMAELMRYVEPMFPKMTDDDEVFNNALKNYSSITKDNLNDAINMLRIMGVNPRQIESLVRDPEVSNAR